MIVVMKSYSDTPKSEKVVKKVQVLLHCDKEFGAKALTISKTDRK
jgi:hypothetical protein